MDNRSGNVDNGARNNVLSSHWASMLNDDSWRSEQIGHKAGLGTFVPRRLRRQVVHHLLQTPFRRMGRKFSHFPAILSAGSRIAKRHHRVFDNDDLRQVLSLACVREHLRFVDGTQVFAVIGDGYARLSSLILATMPRARVVLVNLWAPLRVDLASLRRLWPDLPIASLQSTERTNEQALRDWRTGSARVLALDAYAAAALRFIQADVAFNISSMQEMNPATAQNYVSLLRETPGTATWFYCSNATEKPLPDGTVSRFADYGWDSRDTVVFDELCPWAQKNYQIWPPRYVNRLYDIRHRLTRLDKTPS